MGYHFGHRGNENRTAQVFGEKATGATSQRGANFRRDSCPHPAETAAQKANRKDSGYHANHSSGHLVARRIRGLHGQIFRGAARGDNDWSWPGSPPLGTLGLQSSRKSGEKWSLTFQFIF